MDTPSERIRLGLLCLLLLLMLGILAFTALNTVQAVRGFQQEYSAVKTEDVSAIHPWMTVHMISHIYYIPEDYLCSSLHLGPPGLVRHVTLYEIANRQRQSVDQVVRSLQHAILAYRKQHRHFFTPTPAPKLLSPTPGRTSY